MEVELNNYMMSPTIDSEMNPLTWLQVHQVDFPHLSKLATKHLCIPASSSPSERLFSTFNMHMFKTYQSQYASFPGKNLE